MRTHTASLDAANASALQALSHSTRSLTESVNAIVESVVREAPWQRECEAALRQIQVYKISMRLFLSVLHFRGDA